MPPAFRFCCAVVPPPVPAAATRFVAHVRSLAALLQPLDFITITSLAPYFADEDAQCAAMANEGGTTNIINNNNNSTTQMAADYLQQQMHIPVVLTIVATRGSHSNPSSSSSSSLPNASLTPDGLAAVWRDWIHRVRASTPSQPRGGMCGGVLMLRGDDVVEEAEHTTTTTPRTYATGAELVRGVMDAARTAPHPPDVREEVGDWWAWGIAGFPQGHPAQRVWGPPTPTMCASSSSTTTFVPAVSWPPTEEQRHNSRSFLLHLNRVLADTTIPYSPKGQPPPSLEATLQHATRLLHRVRAARDMHTHFSYFPNDARRAEVRELIQTKVGAMAQTEDVIGGTSRVLVLTQAISSAEEFLRYEEMVMEAYQSELHPTQQQQHVVLQILPGIMTPLRAEEYARVVLQLRLLPPPTLVKALGIYEEHLHEATEKLKHDARMMSSSMEMCCATWMRAKDEAEEHFLYQMEIFTVALAHDLQRAGHASLYFSSFSYSSAEALGRVVKVLQNTS